MVATREECMKPNHFGPFDNDEKREDRKVQLRGIRRPAIDYGANRRELVEYFEARVKRLKIAKTTTTPRGQIVDWIPIESQHPKGDIAAPPPVPQRTSEATRLEGERHDPLSLSELEV